MKYICLIAAVAALVSCSAAEPSADSGFRIMIEDGWETTKSSLTAPGIENMINSVVLASYCKGHLGLTKYFDGGTGYMDFRLENNQEHNVYAFVNMGDVRSRIPEFESALPDFEYRITSFSGGDNPVNEMGIPMAGHLRVIAGSSSPAMNIPVKRLFAKLVVELDSTWPDSEITGVTLHNMNGVLKPFGKSAASVESDMYSYAPEQQICASPSSSAYLVLYVPENLQGTVDGISDSREKSHEYNSTVDARKNFLTYMEMDVRGNGIYEGTVKYRSYLGEDEVSDFNIYRNVIYAWSLSFSEEMLSAGEWKYDNSALQDKRTLQVKPSAYIAAGEDVSISDYVSGNLPLSSVRWNTVSDQGIIHEVINANSLEGSSFSVKPSAFPGQTCRVNVSPKSNAASLGGSCLFTVVSESVSWENTSSGRYYTDPGEDLDTYVMYSLYDGENNIPLKGQYPLRWAFTRNPGAGISGEYIGGSASEYDLVSYHTEQSAIPGSYLISADINGGFGATASLVVNDTRRLEWYDCSSFNFRDIVKYLYLSPNEIQIFISSSSSLTGTGDMYFRITPLMFDANDNGGADSFHGVHLTADNAGTYLTDSWTGGSISTSQIKSNNALMNRLSVVPHVNTALTAGSTHTLTISNRLGMPGKVQIKAGINVLQASGTKTYKYLKLTPSGTTVLSAGIRLTFSASLVTVSSNGNRISSVTTTALQNTSVTWTGASRGVFSSLDPGIYKVTASYNDSGTSLTASSYVKVYKSQGGVEGGWNESEPVTLD